MCLISQIKSDGIPDLIFKNFEFRGDMYESNQRSGVSRKRIRENLGENYILKYLYIYTLN